MRAVIQRVSEGQVSVEANVVGKINKGLVVLLGVGAEDTFEDVRYIVDKVANLRIFEDEQGKLNLSVLEVQGQVMAVSQFTLYGDCRKGRRPSFAGAAPPDLAESLYKEFVRLLSGQGIQVETGRFRTHMMVSLINDGPVTLLLDSKK